MSSQVFWIYENHILNYLSTKPFVLKSEVEKDNTLSLKNNKTLEPNNISSEMPKILTYVESQFDNILAAFFNNI